MDSIPQLRAPADSVDVFVCSHMKRDARCGRLGPPIAAAFTKGTHEFSSLSCPFALLFVSVFRSYAYRILPLLLCQYLTVSIISVFRADGARPGCARQSAGVARACVAR